MPANVNNSMEDAIRQWATTSEDPETGDPIETPENIRTWIDGNMDNIGLFVTDLGDVPSTASERSQTFTNDEDLLRHWLPSGLVYFEDNGDAIPNPQVVIYKFYDDILEAYVYQVYVDDDTG